MSGKRGRSGRRPLPIEEHLLRGTFRADRHGPRPTISGTSAVKFEAPASLPASALKGLGLDGAEFVQQVWAAYSGWTPGKRVLLWKAAELLDAEASIEGGASGSQARKWLALHRAFLSTLNKLALED
jgi:hypothetical protein